MTNFITIFLWRFFAPVWHSLKGNSKLVAGLKTRTNNNNNNNNNSNNSNNKNNNNNNNNSNKK